MARGESKSGWTMPTWLSAIIGVAMLAGAFFIIRHEVAKYKLAQVPHILGAMAWWRIALSGLFTLLGFAALIAHDAIGLDHIRRRLSMGRIALSGFVAYAFSNSAPFSVAVAGTLRLRFYRRWGLTAKAVTKVVGIGVWTYALGLVTAVAIALTVGNFSLPSFIHLPIRNTMPVGILATLLLAGYFAWVIIKQKQAAKAGRPTRMTLVFVLKQVGVSMADWVFSGVALYALISGPRAVPFTLFFGVFILGQLVALVAQLPGGIGVFDAMMIWGLRAAAPAPVVLAALVGYRVIYYLAPLLVATAILFIAEAKHVTRSASSRTPPRRRQAGRRPGSRSRGRESGTRTPRSGRARGTRS